MGLFSGFKSKEKTSFPWIELNSIEQLKEAIEGSTERPIVLFKHSTRCSISSMAKTRFETNWNIENSAADLYYLDLLEHRNISAEMAELTDVQHQSPQAIVLKNKAVIYQDSHSGIDAKEIENTIKSN
jgi:bacillithiol system protein YtxJ